MAAVVIATGIAPSEYWLLTVLERNALVEAAEQANANG